MAKILLLKLSNSFVEPSCSYAVKTVNAYSSTFLDAHSALTAYGFNDVSSLEIKYPLGVLLSDHYKTRDTGIASSLLNRFTLHHLLTKEFSLLKQSVYLFELKKIIENYDICIFFGGLFASLFHTTAIYALSEVAALLGKPTLRLGNFANIDSLFASFHSTNVKVHNFIDTDPIGPLITWVLAQSSSDSNSQCVDSLDSYSPEISISENLQNHFDYFSKSSLLHKDPKKKLLSIYSNPKMLKQRVLTIGGGCPQSCTFCASRKTPSFSRPSHATYDLLRSLSDNSPRDRFYVDLLHADPLADKSYHAASEYASMFTTISPLKSVTRIQTRLALLKNYDPSFFSSLNTRLIYVGLETIDDIVSKKSKKYNNSSQEFVDLASLFAAQGIYLRANLIIGLPDEPDDYIERVYRWASQNSALVGNICVYRPIPGTPDGDRVISTLEPRRPISDYPSTYSNQDILYDDYATSFMSRYDVVPGSPVFQYLRLQNLEKRYSEVFKYIQYCSSRSFNHISRVLIS